MTKNPIKSTGNMLRTPALSRFKEAPRKGVPATVDNPTRVVMIDYTNWRNERRVRSIKPIEIIWGCSEWHPVNQYLLRAKDMEDGKVKDFTMSGIHAWGSIK